MLHPLDDTNDFSEKAPEKSRWYYIILFVCFTVLFCFTVAKIFLPRQLVLSLPSSGNLLSLLALFILVYETAYSLKPYQTVNTICLIAGFTGIFLIILHWRFGSLITIAAYATLIISLFRSLKTVPGHYTTNLFIFLYPMSDFFILACKTLHIPFVGIAWLARLLVMVVAALLIWKNILDGKGKDKEMP